MATRTSAGILLFRRADGDLELLLAHPGGPFFTKRDAGNWTIPKGEVDPGEELLDVARREFLEETGHPPPDGEPIPLGSIVQKGGKTVHGWALEGELDPAAAESNTFEMTWPPGSGRRQSFPEIDRVEWFAPAEAKRRIKATQIPLIDRLEAALDT
jgi:predicted NUDIX family NTP pyrophosphohydrolase